MEVCASFEKNMKVHLSTNKVSHSVEQKIYTAMEKGKN